MKIIGSSTLADVKAIIACTSDILRYFFRSCLRSKINFGRQEFLFSVVKKLQRLPDVQSIRNLTLCNKRGRGPSNNAESGAKIDTSQGFDRCRTTNSIIYNVDSFTQKSVVLRVIFRPFQNRPNCLSRLMSRPNRTHQPNCTEKLVHKDKLIFHIIRCLCISTSAIWHSVHVFFLIK